MAANVSSRQRLLPVLRWAQLCLYLLFLADAMVFSVLQARHLVTLDLSQTHLSLVFSIYGVFQVTGSIAVMLLQTWPRAAQLTTPQQFWVVVAAVCGAIGASLLMTLQPAVFPLLLVARSAQGLFGAVYAIYAMVLMARTFPKAWMLQAVAVMTAGLTTGDSLGPVLGAVLYDRVGISGAYTTQVSAYGAALLALCVLGLWWRQTTAREPLTDLAGAAAPSRVLQVNAEDRCTLPAAVGSITQGKVAASSVPSTQRSDATVIMDCGSSSACDQAVHLAADKPRREGSGSLALAKTRYRDVAAAAPAILDDNASDQQHIVPAFASNSQEHNMPGLVGSSQEQHTTPGLPGVPEPAGIKAILPQQPAAPSLGVWGMLRQWFVVCECALVFGTLTLRVLIDVLMPLAMYTTPTWVLGLVFLGEATGSVAAPFVLDLALVRWPGISTRSVQLLAVALLCVTAPVALLAHLSVPGATIALFCTGAGHSVTEALVYAHLVEYVGCEEDIAVLNAVMSALSLFTVLGCTVGPFIAAAPSHDNQPQQVLAVAAVSAAMLVYTTSYHWLLHKGIIPSQPSKQEAAPPDGDVEGV